MGDVRDSKKRVIVAVEQKLVVGKLPFNGGPRTSLELGKTALRLAAVPCLSTSKRKEVFGGLPFG